MITRYLLDQAYHTIASSCTEFDSKFESSKRITLLVLCTCLWQVGIVSSLFYIRNDFHCRLLNEESYLKRSGENEWTWWRDSWPSHDFCKSRASHIVSVFGDNIRRKKIEHLEKNFCFAQGSMAGSQNYHFTVLAGNGFWNRIQS